MAQISYELQTRQQTTLTPRLQQSVKLLQMSTLDFSREVAEAIANNPFLEEQDDQPPADAMPARPEAEPEAPPSPQASVDGGGEPDIMPATQHIEAEAPSGYSGDYPASRNADQPATDVGQWARSETSLKESLLADASAYKLSERDYELVQYIIEALDDDGYLRIPFSDLADATQFSSVPQEQEWEVALRLVQQLGTPGLGARDLAECLRLQLDARPPSTAGRALALRIVNEQLDRLGRCDYPGLSRALDCTSEDLQQACALIRSLDPRPGGRYSAVDPSCYIVPDVIVRKVGKSWVAVANDSAIPQARLNTVYAQVFKETRYNGRSLMAQALQEARWLMRSLEQRSTTIQRVAQAIVARQQTFFDYGEIALRPLMLSEIADELGLHESTVSRATSNKYLASPRGIYEFKHFFSRELATRSGGTCSAVAVRALIQEMIAEENPQAPLSDVMLASKLAREGVVVARRTVSKYRAQIKYPPAELRRAL
ncbi:MAG TPA: RNA polymerase factor sigma-54 [Burkholderiaceae bacterium]|nr:RNA polymerase factor sigma-54 [Burkholderiaceae bacterium]